MVGTFGAICTVTGYSYLSNFNFFKKYHVKGLNVLGWEFNGGFAQNISSYYCVFKWSSRIVDKFFTNNCVAITVTRSIVSRLSNAITMFLFEGIEDVAVFLSFREGFPNLEGEKFHCETKMSLQKTIPN